MWVIKKKWQSIRSCYTREILKRERSDPVRKKSWKSTYTFYNDLTFLEDIVRSARKLKKIGSNAKLNCNNGEASTSKIIKGEKYISKDENENPEVSHSEKETVEIKSGKGKRKQKQLSKISNLIPLQQNTSSQNSPSPLPDEEYDCDKLFLLSALEDFKRVPETRKMILKMELLEAIRRAQN